MLSNKTRESYIELLKQEVKPALGCTEPIAVALAVAHAKKNLALEVCSAEIEVSANILKNGMGVGIPGTGMIGLNIAAALGVVCGDSDFGLEVLKNVNAEAVATAKSFEPKVSIGVAKTSEKLYVKAICKSADGVTAVTIIQGMHDNIVYAERGGEVLFDKQHAPAGEDNSGAKDTKSFGLTVSSIYEFGTTEPFENIKFILEAATLNRALAAEGLSHDYGLKVGKSIRAKMDTKLFGTGMLTYSMSLTAAASDARMAGCTLHAMSNSGSGNQGITVTLPVVAAAEHLGSSEEVLARALIISHLTAVHIKSHLGRLSALCGCVVASTGSSCGIAYLMGGGIDAMEASIKNMIGNITGMVCDGAKVGCALKVSSGVSSAVQSAMLAMDGICISSNDGIIEDDIEKTIANLGKVGSEGMQATDDIMLNIMINKNRKVCD